MAASSAGATSARGAAPEASASCGVVNVSVPMMTSIVATAGMTGSATCSPEKVPFASGRVEPSEAVTRMICDPRFSSFSTVSANRGFPPVLSIERLSHVSARVTVLRPLTVAISETIRLKLPLVVTS